MSHGFKNAMIAMLLFASVYFYVMNELHGALVDDTIRLCFFEGVEESTVAPPPRDAEI